MNLVLLCLGGAMAAAWGVAHLIPTAKVAAGFGPITDDNRRIITMEWIAEGALLLFAGAVVILVAAVDHHSAAARAVSVASAAALIAMAIVSLFTGFKVKLLPFRLCPPIFTISAALILAGTYA
jgi:hypothetical protein